MKVKYFLSIIFIGFILLNSCKDDDNTAPSITLSNPMDYATIENGTFNLNASVTDNDELSETKIEIRNTANGTIEFEKTEPRTGRQATISESITLDVPDGGSFTLTITAADKSNNSSTESISFDAAATNLGTLDLNFRLLYDGQPMVMFENYNYPEPVFPFSLSLFSFFISDVTIMNGNEELEILEIERLRINENQDDLASAMEGITLSIPLVEPSDYSGIHFGIGVPSDLNAMSPVDFPQGHPLFFSGEYWDSWDSYIYTKVEGKADTDNDGTQETSMALHVGANDTFRTKEYTTNFNVLAQQTSTLNFTIEVKNIFENNGNVYDIISTPQIHSLTQIDQATELANNIKNAFN